MHSNPSAFKRTVSTMSLDEHAPVLTITRDFIDRIMPLVNSLPKDPKQIATTAISNGETVTRLACCIKLVMMYRDMIPLISLNAGSPLHIDKYNENFESELTITSRLPSDSITTVFTCLVASIGSGPLRRFLSSPSSVNPFVQCLRLAFRMTWMLRCRSLAIRGLREMNPLAVLNNALRLCSFPDFGHGPRAALYAALKIPKRVDITHLAYSIPITFLNDSSRQMYEDLKETFDHERQQRLEELEQEIKALVQRKQTSVFFSSSTDIRDSLVVLLTADITDMHDPMQSMVRYFMYELSPDKEREKFAKEFANACSKASKLRFDSVGRRFELISFVNYDEPPAGEKALDQAKDRVASRQKKTGFSMAGMFLPRKDFIAETKNIRI